MSVITIAGGRITCPQCTATSKRSQKQCQSPAMFGKRVCRIHGGKSTGPKTAEGRARIAAAHTVHGFETRQLRRELSTGLAELADLEAIARSIGLIGGPKRRGRPPKG